jgi:hypothetical protein
MASKKKGPLSKYCRIFQWVEAQDPDFAGAIRDLCLEGVLSPGGRSAGVTFLYPKDKDYRKEIIEKTYSDAADEAVRLVESLVIPDALLAGADFHRRPVGSRLGVKYVVESADGGQVRLAGGVELAPAADFDTLARRTGDLAVWIVTKGRLPLQGEAYKPPMPTRVAKGGAARARGGNGGGGVPGARQLLAATAESEYDCCMRRDGARAHNPYLARVVSLLNYLKARNPDVLLSVLPVLDYEPVVTFYLLLEPYKTGGDHLIADGVLFGEGAWNGADAYADAVEEYKAFFRSLPAQAAASATDSQSGQPVVPYVFRDRGAVAAQVDAVRQQYGGLNPRQGPQMVQDVYATLAGQNSIQGMGPILPDATLRALAGSKKLWQDEFRFTVHEALQSMRQMPYASDVFAGIVRDLRAAWPGNNYAAEIRLANAADILKNVAPRLELLLLTKFVNSTDFLYTPAAPDEVGGAWGNPNDPTDWQVYNRNAAALANLGRIQGMVRPAGVSPQTLQELQIYVQTHGQLPPAVSALAAGR